MEAYGKCLSSIVLLYHMKSCFENVASLWLLTSDFKSNGMLVSAKQEHQPFPKSCQGLRELPFVVQRAEGSTKTETENSAS